MRELVILPWLALAACGSDEAGDDNGKGEDRKPVDPVTVVEVAPVALGSVAEMLASTAVVESEAQADIIPSAPGVVLSLHKDEGDPVERGDLLAVLDNVSLGAGAERTRAEVQRLEQQVNDMRELHRRGAVSDRELADLEYSLRGARTSAREASRSFGQTRLTAPFAGVVASRNVRIGELAMNGAPAFRVVDLERLRVVTSLPERDLSRVAVGQPARLVSAYDAEVSGTGVVVRIAPVVDSTSGTFRVTLDLGAEQDALRPGQFVSVDLEVDRHDDVLVVPRKALVYEDGEPLVYLMVDPPPPEEDSDEDGEDAEDEGSSWPPAWWPFGGGDADEDGDEDGAEDEDEGPKKVAQRTLVELGLVDDAAAEIVEGVAAGDLVITVGQSHLRDGARVRAIDPDAGTDEEAEAEAEAEAADAAEDGAEG